MLVFIDESGDPGLLMGAGSSKLFVVVLVVFEEEEEATACDQRIAQLRKELRMPADHEFHFRNNADRLRLAFLHAVSPYSFFYYAVVMDKESLMKGDFQEKKSFYKYACGLVFQNIKDKLSNATIIIDESGSLDFKRKLQAFLKAKGKYGSS